MNNIVRKKFSELDLNDTFFDTLKSDYPEFECWFLGKRNQDAFVQYDQGKITGFLYMKIENDYVSDVVPPIRAHKILKVGTFKINAHGTKMGEQFVKVILDVAVSEAVDVCYVTIFPKHKSLINLINKYGFAYCGTKGAGEPKENVYLKRMGQITGNINADFPYVDMTRAKKYLLSIYPKYHSVMFPDSILTTENKNIITDVSYTNSIHKIYVCTMDGVDDLKYGDIVVLYRTAEEGKSAEYSAVASSICVVEDVKKQAEFFSFDEFYEYVCKYSVFDKADLRYWFRKGGCKVIKMTYNGAFRKKIIRHDLIEKMGLPRDRYWGFLEINDDQFLHIVEKGGLNEIIKK